MSKQQQGVSKSSKAIHKKWQMEAEAKGGKGAKVILGKSQAKEVIFNLLKDSFRPMNITSIYETLKATVPSPLLKACLESMSISPNGGSKSKNDGSDTDDDDDEHNGKGISGDDDDGDDDDDDDDFVKSGKKSKKKKKKKKKSSSDNNTTTTAASISSSSSSSSSKKDDQKYKGTLYRKVGRNANTTLYYVNQNKLHNNGDGMTPDERNELHSASASSKEEYKMKLQSIQSINDKTKTLQSEPLNDKMKTTLPKEEEAVQGLVQDVEAARKVVVNESQLKSVRRNIEKMTKFWRKRRRVCIEFLNTMEDCTEGTISAKKCLAGSGQIEIESDDVVVKQAKAMYANKRKLLGGGNNGGSMDKRRKVVGGGGKPSGNKNGSVDASVSFVAVLLGPSGVIQRVHAE